MKRSYGTRLLMFELIGLIIIIGSLHMPARAQQIGDCAGCVPWAGMIRGRVVNAQGRGMRGITVHALKFNQEKGLILTGETNREGFFHFFVPHGRYTVYAGNESIGYPETYGGIYLDEVMHLDIVVAKDKVTKVRLRLGHRLHALSGRIVNASTGEKVKDANYTISLISDPHQYVESAPDLIGRFRRLSPPAPFTLKVYAPGFETKEFVLKPNSSKKLLVALRPETTRQSRP